MKIRGRVKWFNSKKGYGFITKEDGSGDVFVHWTDIKAEGYKTLNAGEEVEFEEKVDQRGVKAINVVKLSRSGGKPSQRQEHPRSLRSSKDRR